MPKVAQPVAEPEFTPWAPEPVSLAVRIMSCHQKPEHFPTGSCGCERPTLLTGVTQHITLWVMKDGSRASCAPWTYFHGLANVLKIFEPSKFIKFHA